MAPCSGHGRRGVYPLSISHPHHLELLSYVSMRCTVEVVFRADAYMIRRSEFDLLAEAETVHGIWQRTHVRFLVLVENLPACAAFVR